jgi:hypothetical protein
MTEKNFEDVFKDKLSHFEADVNPSVWQSVQSGLTSKGAAVSGASGASQAAGTFAGLGAKGMLWIAGALSCGWRRIVLCTGHPNSGFNSRTR